MNQEQAKEAAKVVLHYANGGDIEYKNKQLCGDNWEIVRGRKNLEVAFDFGSFSYRIRETEFKWRGKDIHWVRRIDAVSRKVIDVGGSGIMITGPTSSGFDLLSWLELASGDFEWSTNNSTWNGF